VFNVNLKSIFALFLALALFSPINALADDFSKVEAPLPAPDAPPNRSASELTPPATLSPGSEAPPVKHPRLVLALSGGACKAAAEIGVLRSLEKHHIVVDEVVATSMGSTVGALYCAGVSVDDIEKLFVDGTLHSALFKGVVLDLLTSPIASFVDIFTGRPYYGLTAGRGYVKLLNAKLPATFADLKIPFAAVVTNLTDGQTAALTSGDLPQAVLASNSVPTLFRPVKIGDKLYVDGGLKANLPATIARGLGAEMVVAVLVDTAIKPVSNKIFRSKTALEKRVVDVMLASSDKAQTKASDVLIFPNVDFVPSLTKDPKIIRKAIEEGERAADSVALKIQSDLMAINESRKLPGDPDKTTATRGPVTPLIR
jgi:NTE family protein